MLSVLFAAALFAEGRTEWVVSVPDDAARPLAYAAEELTDVIRRIDEMRTFRDMGLVRVKTELGVSPLGQSGETPRAKARIKQFAQRLGNYAWATMAFDPDVTPEDVLRDFCEHVYGDGAEEMVACHGLMERVWGTWIGHLTNFLHDRTLLVLPWAGYHCLIHSLTTPEMSLDTKDPPSGMSIIIR